MENAKKCASYYLGLDVGTDSVGYAAVSPQYDLLKYRGKTAWGTTLFDEAALNTDRRAFRTARRRLDRRQQRVVILQELFASEIAKVDPRFFIRLQESWKLRSEAEDAFPVFVDEGYTDQDYYKQYPTIHHLIAELMNSAEPHDVRLVYLACAWLVAHRGHFLSNISVDNIAQIKDLTAAYDAFFDWFTENEYGEPWRRGGANEVGAILKARKGVTRKTAELAVLLFEDGKAPKLGTEEFPFSRASLIKLLAGGKSALNDLFCTEEYEDAEIKSFSLDMDEEKFTALEGILGERYGLVAALRAIFDWAVLNDLLGDAASISASKVQIFEQHKKDLRFLKDLIRAHAPEKYDEVFREVGKKNYPAYARHTDEANAAENKLANKEDFSKFILGIVKNIKPAPDEQALYDDMLARLDLRTFLPKQKDPDNRVIPHQLYLYELNAILKNASAYLPFLNEKDADGLTAGEKIVSIFTFRVPYYVGPLNPYFAPGTKESRRPWIVRRGDQPIRPWNFDALVDKDASEEAFIKRMTNTCTYLPDQPVLPKDSLMYHKFTVLNEINNLKINGERISVELKQRIYNDLFLQKKKVTRKRLVDFLIERNVIERGQESAVSGVDETIKSDLVPQIAFRRLLESGAITEADAERMIERAAYAEDKTRFAKWLESSYPKLSSEDRKYICTVRVKDFGRLSAEFLNGMTAVDGTTGEVMTILAALWDTQMNLNELLFSDRFTFKEELEKRQKEYFAGHSVTLDERLDEMRLSNAVRRTVYRTLAVARDVEKAFGAPKKIFIETARGGLPEQKGKRTVSRKDQILELYAKCRDEDVRYLKEQLDAMGVEADNRLQGDKLFLYFMQLGKCLYTGKSIDIEKLGSGAYNIEHIYPQSVVKDDSILNNEILVDSEANGQKSDTYPVSADIQSARMSLWLLLKKNDLMSDEKFRRLTRTTPFSADERMGFISRQLTETSQAAKAIAEILKEKYPEAEIVYCKAGLVSEFRNEFDIWKSRLYNDLHHAVDAYLNAVTGNVYNMRFTKRWFDPSVQYSVKAKTLFTNTVKCGGETVWNGESDLNKVKKIAVDHRTINFTKFAYIKKGGFFDQMPVAAAPGLKERKKGMPTEVYGGYNKPGVAFFIPVKYVRSKKSEILITSVEVMFAGKVLADEAYALDYLKERVEKITGKPADSVSLPMGLRPWKVNTMLSLDGFRVCIAGSSNAGKGIIPQPFMPFITDPKWIRYLKKIEAFVEKISKNENYVYKEIFDHVSPAENLELYDLYVGKLRGSVYAKRMNNPVDTLIAGREKFAALEIKEQCRAIANIHQVFGRISGGCDLTAIGGKGKAAATVSFSSAVSNWKKNYSDVRLLDVSPSGLWEKRSGNLLDLL